MAHVKLEVCQPLPTAERARRLRGMSNGLPPRVSRLVRRAGRVVMHGTMSAANAAVGPEGIAGTGVGPRGALAPLVALGALAGNETCADATEVIAAQWASGGGERVGDMVRAKIDERRKAKAERRAEEARTVDQVVPAPAPEAAPVAGSVPMNGRAAARGEAS